MRKNSLLPGVIVTLILFDSACVNSPSANNSSRPDSVATTKGKLLFAHHCSSCHNFSQDGIGPDLSGVINKLSRQWLYDFIADPSAKIESGDTYANELYKKYRVKMPSFPTLKKDELEALVSFISIHNSGTRDSVQDYDQIKDPIPDKIKMSSLVVDLHFITQLPASSENKKPPLARITKIGLQPESKDLFIADLRGKLYRLKKNRPTVFLDLPYVMPAFISDPGLATGFGSFAFHPDYAKNGLLYTTHTEAKGTKKGDFSYNDSIPKTLQWVLTEWQTKSPSSAIFSGTSRELLRIDMIGSMHGIQEISFNPYSKKGDRDYGLLFIEIGDGGSVEDGYSFLVGNKKNIWGSLLLIDPLGRNSLNGQYGIPADNPFIGDADPAVQKELFAYGFRNPHRITWLKSKNIVVTNIGQANIESLNIVSPGDNFGWPHREGSFALREGKNINNVYPLPANDSTFHLTYPAVQYDHDEGKAISGGYEYIGRAVPELKGKFLFGDIPTGRLFYTDVSKLQPGKTQVPIFEWQIRFNKLLTTLKKLCGDDRVDLHFGKDSNGELYIMTKADGKIYKLVATGR